MMAASTVLRRSYTARIRNTKSLDFDRFIDVIQVTCMLVTALAAHHRQGVLPEPAADVDPPQPYLEPPHHERARVGDVLAKAVVARPPQLSSCMIDVDLAGDLAAVALDGDQHRFARHYPLR